MTIYRESIDIKDDSWYSPWVGLQISIQKAWANDEVKEILFRNSEEYEEFCYNNIGKIIANNDTWEY